VGTDSTLLGSTSFQNEPLSATDGIPDGPRVASDGSSALVVWVMDGNVQAILLER
jgi:hypothetical protein